MSSNIFSSEARNEFKWMNEPEHWAFTERGELHVEAPAGADFFKDPAQKHMVSSAPFLFKQIEASCELTVQLQVDMHHIYDSGCLMLMADDNNWAKLCYEFNGEYPTIVSVVTKDGSSDDCNSMQVTTPAPFLRITKLGKVVSFYYSENGERWTLVRYFGVEESRSYVAGVVAQSPQGKGCRVIFQSLSIMNPEAGSRF